MAKLEISEETGNRLPRTGAADLLIAIAAPVDEAELRVRASEAVHGLPEMLGLEGEAAGLRAAVAFPGVAGSAEAVAGSASPPERIESQAGKQGELQFLPYAQTNTPSAIPLLSPSASYQPLFGMARDLGVSACVVVASDLAALKAELLQQLLVPIFEQRCDLSMPVYSVGKLEGLLNVSVLAPLTRALYGRRVRFPLAPDFGLSAQLLPGTEQPLRRMVSQGQTLFWPATEAAVGDRRICQVYMDVRHPAAADGVDLSTVLTQTVAPLFAEMEATAALWQSVRGSQTVEISGIPPTTPPDGPAVDVRPMIETFNIGFQNLQDVWSPVLPPVALLELKRLTRLNAEQFRMPDELWVRIVYDFALAYRLRSLSRSHLLGALAPLYLGWVASYALEVANLRAHEVEHRVERLARAYEEGKPYLLSRWRWPDRFNP
jgi:glucosylglycerate synthase